MNQLNFLNVMCHMCAQDIRQADMISVRRSF